MLNKRLDKKKREFVLTNWLSVIYFEKFVCIHALPKDGYFQGIGIMLSPSNAFSYLCCIYSNDFINMQQRIVILGATSGIGKEVAKLYIQRGWMVGILGRRTALLEEIANNHPNVMYETCDVCDTALCIEALQRIYQRMGGVDLFLQCSGIGRMNANLETSIELSTIDTNTRGWTACICWAWNTFMKQGHGHLAAITSIASLRGLAPAPAYSASKAYQAHYLEALQQRAMAGTEITVTNIRPGFVDTPLLADTSKFFWVVSVEKAARQIVKALDKRKSTCTVTHRWKWLVPAMLLIPNCIYAKFIGRKS